jgi:hypothetical protein
LLGRCHRAEFGYLNGSDMEPPQGVEPWTYALRVEVKPSTKIAGSTSSQGTGAVPVRPLQDGDGAASVPAKAEGVAGRIEVYPEQVACRLTWLHRMPCCAELQHVGFDRVDIVDGQVEVELLRPLARRPRRRCELVSQLKRHAQPVDRKDDPVIIGKRDLPTDDTSVELSKRPRVGAVEDHGSHTGDWHGRSVFHERDGGR